MRFLPNFIKLNDIHVYILQKYNRREIQCFLADIQIHWKLFHLE